MLKDQLVTFLLVEYSYKLGWNGLLTPFHSPLFLTRCLVLLKIVHGSENNMVYMKEPIYKESTHKWVHLNQHKWKVACGFCITLSKKPIWAYMGIWSSSHPRERSCQGEKGPPASSLPRGNRLWTKFGISGPVSR